MFYHQIYPYPHPHQILQAQPQAHPHQILQAHPHPAHSHPAHSHQPHQDPHNDPDPPKKEKYVSDEEKASLKRQPLIILLFYLLFIPCISATIWHGNNLLKENDLKYKEKGQKIIIVGSIGLFLLLVEIIVMIMKPKYQMLIFGCICLIIITIISIVVIPAY